MVIKLNKGFFRGIHRRQLKDATVQYFEEIKKEPTGSFLKCA